MFFRLHDTVKTICVGIKRDGLQIQTEFSLLIFNVQVLARYDPLNEYTEPNLSTTVFNMSRVLQPPASLPGKCLIC